MKNERLEEIDSLLFETVRRDIITDGWICEGNYKVNNLSDRLIEVMYEEFGECHLWQLNPYNDMPHHAVYVPGEFHYAASQITPVYDEELERLILERLNAEYTTTAADGILVDAILNRVSELGGYSLFYS